MKHGQEFRREVENGFGSFYPRSSIRACPYVQILLLQTHLILCLFLLSSLNLNANLNSKIELLKLFYNNSIYKPEFVVL